MGTYEIRPLHDRVCQTLDTSEDRFMLGSRNAAEKPDKSIVSVSPSRVRPQGHTLDAKWATGLSSSTRPNRQVECYELLV